MFGDFSRDSFDPAKDRSSVRHQAGRTVLGDDFNEQRDIDLHENRTTNEHVIGDASGPAVDLGFEITVAGGGASLEVGAGQYYVGGIRVHRRQPGQVHDLPTAAGRYLLYLDVWERSVNAVQDPSIREVALGGPDTTVRTEVMHEVRALALPGGGPPPNCSQSFPEWDAVVAGSTAAMALWVEEGAATTDPCLVPETAGYKGPDNRFIRVQVHDGNYDPGAPGGLGAATPTFTWARDNASIVASWMPPSDLVVAIDRLGPGGTEGFVAGAWVEFTTDARERAGEPGILAEIDAVVAGGIQLVDPGGLSAALTALHDPDAAPIARRWDSPGPIEIVEGSPIDLNDGTNSDGLQVQFEPGRIYRSGDYWTVAARTAILPGTADRQIDWPVDGAGNPLVLDAKGPEHHVARLALANFDGNAWTMLSDCREEFAPLSDLVTFVGRGGDGQEAPGGHWLSAPLWVGAGHGTAPLVDEEVEFRVLAGNGTLSADAPNPDGTAASVGASISVQTDANGLARVFWRLGPSRPIDPPGDRFDEDARQLVVARLLSDSGDAINQPVRFYARATEPRILVGAGGDGQWGHPGETLEIAPRARVSVGSQPAVGARVEFEVVTTMENGDALDEVRGGAVHATVGLVDSEPWPGGSAAFRAVVEADAEGVAQVQWRLGTEPDLPVQRLYAHLLDDTGQRTGHFTFFTAHHAVADEIRWQVPTALLPFLPSPESRHSVQDGLDLLTSLFTSLANGRVDGPAGSRPLSPATVMAATDVNEIVVMVPGRFPAPAPSALDALMEVSMALPFGGRAVRVIVPGTVRVERRQQRTEIRWRPVDQAWQGAFSGTPDAFQEGLALVTVRPAMFGTATMMTEWSGGLRVQRPTGGGVVGGGGVITGGGGGAGGGAGGGGRPGGGVIGGGGIVGGGGIIAGGGGFRGGVLGPIVRGNLRGGDAGGGLVFGDQPQPDADNADRADDHDAED